MLSPPIHGIPGRHQALIAGWVSTKWRLWLGDSPAIFVRFGAGFFSQQPMSQWGVAARSYKLSFPSIRELCGLNWECKNHCSIVFPSEYPQQKTDSDIFRISRNKNKLATPLPQELEPHMLIYGTIFWWLPLQISGTMNHKPPVTISNGLIMSNHV